MIRRTVLLVAIISLLFTPIQLFADQTAPGGGPQAKGLEAASRHVKLKRTTDSFATVISQTQEFAKKHGPENILLVVDLDNTLLAMNQDLGSDQWFVWQEGLLKRDQTNEALVATDFDGLLRAQEILFSLSSMHPPEPEIPTMLDAQIKGNVCVVILTSRGKEFRDSTMRVLKENSYSLIESTLDIVEERGPFAPYDPSFPSKHGLTAEIIAKLGPSRSVTYSDGIYMTAGQHKGYMLKTLLARSPQASQTKPFANFKAIVFVDDHTKHVDRVHAAFAEEPIDLATFRYSREDQHVEAFMRSEKKSVAQSWISLKQMIEKTFTE